METVKSVKQRTIEAFNLKCNPYILEEKNWGCKQTFSNRDHDVCYILKGGYCSTHYHNFNDNIFYCLNGLIKIYIQDIDFDLGPGEMIAAPRKIVHSFLALENSIILEEYCQFRGSDDFDIVRYNDGGIKDV